MSTESPQFDTTQAKAEDVVKLVSGASDEQIAEVISGPQREQILAEIFRRMSEHFKAGSAEGVDAVIHWQITGKPDGGVDSWEVTIKDGKCTASAEPVGEPRVTFKMDGVDFLKLVTGNAAGPAMFMTGKLKIEGDLMFSARIQSLFQIPTG
jgi:putative sterol carrier protein